MGAYPLQGRVQDLKKGGAGPIVREARAQKKISHAPNDDHAPSLTRSWMAEKAVLGLVSMRNCCLVSEF
jgi:hypothetical protein